MRPSGDAREVEGVLNPAAVRAKNDSVFLFPRLVGEGNYSRIGLARVRYASANPICVERAGVVLEPSEPYEKRPGGGGCEDPRISFVAPLGLYTMTYTALSAVGPRIAIAVSDDLHIWRKLGLAYFDNQTDLNFNTVINKDAVIFPESVNDMDGNPCIAMLHRPLFPGTTPATLLRQGSDRSIDLLRESIWISYAPVEAICRSEHLICHFTSHRRLLSPIGSWERLKIGSGTPPMLTRHGWFMVYHGVGANDDRATELTYSAGVVILDSHDITVVRYRSAQPVLVPDIPEEISGVVPRVVFPSGIDRRDDIGQDVFDVYYGQADYSIGAARLSVPSELPPSAVGSDAIPVGA
jgi:predicted GH43/DUF377 family glycosyl hydrolase